MMIIMDRVTKKYAHSARPALEKISLEIDSREFAILVGASGAGKSTLLKLLTREEKPDSGKIVVGGIDYDTLDDRDIPLLRRKIGVVFQDFKLLPNRTVFENVALSLEIGGYSNKEIRENVPRILELVGLRGKEKSFPKQLSGGEKQRVAIARAMVRQPKILIADEPTGNLDPRNTWEIVKLLLKINKFGTTVLLITHSQEIVNRLNTRVITLDEGKIVADVEHGAFRDMSREKSSEDENAAKNILKKSARNSENLQNSENLRNLQNSPTPISQTSRARKSARMEEIK